MSVFLLLPSPSLNYLFFKICRNRHFCVSNETIPNIECLLPTRHSALSNLPHWEHWDNLYRKNCNFSKQKPSYRSDSSAALTGRVRRAVNLGQRSSSSLCLRLTPGPHKPFKLSGPWFPQSVMGGVDKNITLFQKCVNKISSNRGLFTDIENRSELTTVYKALLELESLPHSLHSGCANILLSVPHTHTHTTHMHQALCPPTCPHTHTLTYIPIPTGTHIHTCTHTHSPQTRFSQVGTLSSGRSGL